MREFREIAPGDRFIGHDGKTYTKESWNGQSVADDGTSISVSDPYEEFEVD